MLKGMRFILNIKNQTKKRTPQYIYDFGVKNVKMTTKFNVSIFKT
jgi:hypothetical protein